MPAVFGYIEKLRPKKINNFKRLKRSARTPRAITSHSQEYINNNNLVALQSQTRLFYFHLTSFDFMNFNFSAGMAGIRWH